MRRWVCLLLGLAALATTPSAAAAARDPANRALNIIPSGQYGSFPIPDGADEQALMYDALTPLFDRVRGRDLNAHFKSQGLGVGPDGPATIEPVPNPDVTIERDRFNVPHVTARTYEGGIWAAGWIAAEDRGLLLEQARWNARVAAVDVPGLSAIGLLVGLANFRPSAQTEAEVARQVELLERRGPEGRALLRDIDTFIGGINDYLERHSPGTEPWTRNDVIAVNALKGQFLGEGGGDEARRSEFLAALRAELGRRQAKAVFDDLRQFRNPELSASVDGRFPYGHIPRRPRGNVVLDPGSFQSQPAVQAPRRFSSPPPGSTEASNVLMIDAEHSTNGRPLMVGGPQIGYFYPGLTYEIDMNAPGLRWRGATSAPFPGYLLIGRTRDFAVTLTSASGDIVDQYVERLCGSDTSYRYRGRCREMERFEAGILNGEPVTFMRTVHGPVVGYATVDGERVAISQRRSSYGRDVLDQLFFRRMSTGAVDGPRSFFDAANQTPQTFNAFYMDRRRIAAFTSGRYPIRPRRLDPGLPALGTGRFEWRGFLPQRRHPRGIGARDGTIVNWNQTLARGFGAADDQWMRSGSVGRIDLLDRNLHRLQRRGRWNLARVTAAMNAAATQDVRAIVTVPLLRKLLVGSRAPSPQARRMLAVLAGWRASGGSRLDRDLDGRIDHPGAAVMDAAWPKIADALFARRLGSELSEQLARLVPRFEAPPGGQYSGWYQYLDRDLRRLLGLRLQAPLRVRYCGNGRLAACRADVWAALAEAGAELSAEQGTEDPEAWRADATAERIRFLPGLLPTTIRYTNRPSGIQQLISFGRPR